jgi:hypothetical protein
VLALKIYEYTNITEAVANTMNAILKMKRHYKVNQEVN